MSEKEVEKSIVQFLLLKGFYAQKIQSGAVYRVFKYATSGQKQKVHKITMAERGTPDLFACVEGKFVAIEVKRDEKVVSAWYRQVRKYEEDGKVTKANEHAVMQYEQLTRIEKAGGIAMCIGSLDQLVEQLNEYNIII